MGGHEIANTILICIVVIVSIYVVVNIDSTFTAFKALYNNEQNIQHTKIGAHIGQLSKNDGQLKTRGDKHEKELEDHASLLQDDKEDRAEKKIYTVLDGHDTMLLNHASLLQDSNTNRNPTNVYEILDAQKNTIDTHNTKVTENERRLQNLTFADGEGGSLVIKNSNHEGENNITMKADGSIELNVTDPANLKSCTGGTCKPFVLAEEFTTNNTENKIINLNNTFEKFANGISIVGGKVVYKKGDKEYKLALDGNCSSCQEKGPKGDSGEQGERGERGLTGKEGAQGVQGDKGLKGDKGATGGTGEQGEAGLNKDQIGNIIDTRLAAINDKIKNLQKTDEVTLDIIELENFIDGSNVPQYEKFRIKQQIYEQFDTMTDRAKKIKDKKIKDNQAEKEKKKETQEKTLQVETGKKVQFGLGGMSMEDNNGKIKVSTDKGKQVLEVNEHAIKTKAICLGNQCFDKNTLAKMKGAGDKALKAQALRYGETVRIANLQDNPDLYMYGGWWGHSGRFGRHAVENWTNMSFKWNGDWNGNVNGRPIRYYDILHIQNKRYNTVLQQNNHRWGGFRNKNHGTWERVRLEPYKNHHAYPYVSKGDRVFIRSMRPGGGHNYLQLWGGPAHWRAYRFHDNNRNKHTVWKTFQIV